jgi:inner membrane protein
VDNVTHALAGLLVADAAAHWMERRGERLTLRARRALSVLGVVAAEFPDSDLLYSGPVLQMGSLGYLLHHRGHTHTIVWAVASAVLLWAIARWWVRGGEGGSSDAGRSNYGRWHYGVFGVAVVGTLSHLLLDYTNSYGVHPFWPLDNRWFYGDAVFIVEPWLWLVSIPALFFNRPSRGSRALLALLLLTIVAATLLLGQVARDVALVLVVFAGVWPLVQWRASPAWRTASGLGAWALVTSGFFAASARAESAVRRAVEGGASGELVLDVSLNPGPGDWGCWSALVMSTDGDDYRVTSAFVAPFARVRPLATCDVRYRAGRIGSDVLDGLPEQAAAPFAATPQVQWRSSWRTSRAALGHLVRSRCEVEAALHFMRAPVWQRAGRDSLLLSDARFGVGGGGFSEFVFPVTGACSLRGRWIPGWQPPRADVSGNR